MVHGPCGKLNPTSPCMEDGKCSKGFTKPFCEKTVIRTGNTYPEYQRLDPAHGGRSIVVTRASRKHVGAAILSAVLRERWRHRR